MFEKPKLTLVLFGQLAGACVSPYNTPPITVAKTDVVTEIALRYEVDDKNPVLSGNWRNVMATCRVMRGLMVREVDRIETQNRIIGSGFAALAAGMATSSGVYSLWKGDDADARVTATLGLGAGLSTIPTFAYFGSDKRKEEVSARIHSIDEQLDACYAVYEKLQAADRQQDVVNRGTDADLQSVARQARQTAQDGLDAALMKLARQCS